MQSKDFSIFILWFVINTLVVKTIFNWGFNLDIGVLVSSLITFLYFQIIGAILTKK
jgi:hypothetical protein